MDGVFCYKANAAGRLAGCFLSGLVCQRGGVMGALVAASVFLVAAWRVGRALPREVPKPPVSVT